jgi:hypothetical protein
MGTKVMGRGPCQCGPAEGMQGCCYLITAHEQQQNLPCFQLLLFISKCLKLQNVPIHQVPLKFFVDSRAKLCYRG